MTPFIRTSLLLAFFLGGTAVADTGADTDGTALTERLSVNLPSCGRFEQHRWLADLDTNLTSSGYFLREESALIWHTTTPVVDRVRLESDNPDLPMGLKAMLPVLTGLLAGDWTALRRHFDIALDGEPDAWQAELTPRDDALAERLQRINVTGGDRVEQLKLPFADGDRLTLSLTPADCQRLRGEAGRS